LELFLLTAPRLDKYLINWNSKMAE